MINCLTLGTCRLLCLFDDKYNSRKLINSIHYCNLDAKGGNNFITCTHDSIQTIHLLKILFENIIINKNNKNIDYYNNNYVMCLTKKKWAPQINYLKTVKNYDINKCIKNINNDINNIKYYIIEISSLKILKINNNSLFLDLNKNKEFKKIEKEEFIINLNELYLYIKQKKSDAKIIFMNHFYQIKDKIIEDRLNINIWIKEFIKNKNECFLINPSEILDEYTDILNDGRHYAENGYKKMLEYIENLILNIENSNNFIMN